MYAEAVDDEKLRMLAFEDRWHFVALLCLKAGGSLDKDRETLMKRLSLKLGLAEKDLHELKNRLFTAKLILKNWQPIAWNKRQFVSDNSTVRVRRHRAKQAGNVTETPSVTETPEKRFGNAPDAESDSEQNRTKNPLTPPASGGEPVSLRKAGRNPRALGTNPRGPEDAIGRIWRRALDLIAQVNGTHTLTWAYVAEQLADPMAHNILERIGYRVIADADKFLRRDLKTRFCDAYEQRKLPEGAPA